jgi:hypothetical protein
MTGKQGASVAVFLAAVTTLVLLWRSQRPIPANRAQGADPAREGEVAEEMSTGGFGDELGSNLILNGSFEDGHWLNIPDWDKIGEESPGIYTARSYKGANATDGRQALDVGVQGMGGGNEVSQEVPTKAGVTYNLSFDWGSEYAWGVSGEVEFRDAVTNITLSLVDRKRVKYPQIEDTLWIVHRVEHRFTANGPGILTFRQIYTGSMDEDYGGLAIDNVVIEPVGIGQGAPVR